ncbi:hypothetical protein MKEN_00169000 [Mycena kentingensis (nom. inval.)]|nr:hypothetical protein MKEN_00169000 [Mycena kentingensis (nom. inval.)]
MPSVQLPRTLERPVCPKVARAALLAASPDLGFLPVEDIRKDIRHNYNRLDVGRSSFVRSIPAGLPRSQLPPYMTVPAARPRKLLVPLNAPPVEPIQPTHLLAIGNTNPSTLEDVHLLFPIHAAVLAAECAKLPPLPPSAPAPVNGMLHLPVLPLALPSAPGFSILLGYLYHHNPGMVLNTVLPLSHEFIQQMQSVKALRATINSPTERHYMAQHLGRVTGWSMQTLMKHMGHIKELWQDMVALGIDEDGIWETVEFGYEIVLAALNLAVMANNNNS